MIGANGEGKSNLLEAVELLGCLRSHRTGSDRDLIQHGESSSQVRAATGNGDLLQLHLRRSGGRTAQRNGKVLERQLDLLGSLRCVGFSALDLELVRGEPAGRRQWLDRVVLQLEPVYGDLLSRYGRLLRQRSQLLRRSLGGGTLQALLDTFDLQMAVIGTRLHRRRFRAIQRLEPLAAAWQQRLSGGREQLQLHYQSGTALSGEDAEEPWRQALLEQLQQQRSEELRLGQCTVGPHRDELGLSLANQPARRYGSAGQQRTWCWPSSWPNWNWWARCWGSPLLLLDDVLAELDPVRQQLLLEAVGEGHQCLVSATHLGLLAAAGRPRARWCRCAPGCLRGRSDCSRALGTFTGPTTYGGRLVDRIR